MALFKKPKRNFRARDTAVNDEDEEDHPPVKVNVSKKEKKVAKQPPKTQSLLSFDDDLNEGDDGEVFQVKKSSQSKKMRKLLDKERKKKREPNDSEKKLTETKTQITTEDDIVITVKNTLPILNGREAESATLEDVSSEDDEPGHHKFTQSSKDVKSLLQRGSIPDAATIHAARKQRQHRREMGDFIPVSEEPQRFEKENGGRLIREDDASDGEEERIKMAVDTAAEDRLLLHAQFNAAQDKDADVSDNEDDDWEAQQIRKGVTGAQIAAVQQETMYYQQFTESQGLVAPPAPIISDIGPMAAAAASAAVALATAPQPPPVSHPPTALSIINRLKSRLEELNIVRKNHLTEMNRWRDEVASLGSETETKRSSTPALESKFHFYQETRGYVTDLVECLDEKIVVIDKLEERVIALLSKRVQESVARRRQDVQDQATELPILPSGKLAVRDEAMTRRVAEREGRRIRRQRARELRLSHMPHIDGMSSDDETTEVDVINLKNTRETIERDAKQVFEDTVDDFCSVDGVLRKFEDWRLKEPDSYSEAYASLCIPKVLGPLIRISILFWNPLAGSTTDFENFSWYQSLLLYGLSRTETEDSLKKDPDVQLLPRIIDKVVLPKLNSLISNCWDALSSSQTICLVATVTKLIQDYPTLCYNSKALKVVLDSVINKLKEALDNDVFIPIYPKPRLADGKVSSFFMRQCTVAIKLLGNMARWQGLLAESVLTDLAIDSLLNRYLVMALRSCQPITAASIVHMVGTVLPRVWLSTCVSQLSPFLNQVQTISLQLNVDKPLERNAIERMSTVLKTPI